jgi:tripeptidyl-peptidase-1
LDIQWIQSLATDTETWFWSVPWSPLVNPFLKFVKDLAANPNPPDVHSISYLNSENEVYPDAMRLFNSEVCKLGLRGITVIVASGDEGAPGKEGCRPLDKKNECKLRPSFPANCPYVTTVGATMGPENGLDAEEVACALSNQSKWWAYADITSGGGFSTIFPRPAWQYRAVKKYLNSAFNKSPGNTRTWGRGYPDVSMAGYHMEFFLNDTRSIVSGTSGSAPTFASLISLINGMRIKRKLPKLGFLNPLLYNKVMAGAFRDITEGNNTCCAGSKGLCCKHGWFTAPGWDPVTGLGSPKIDKWIDILTTDFRTHHHSQPPPQGPPPPELLPNPIK